MSHVVVFNNRVKKITDTESELMTTKARLPTRRSPASDAPTTTGKSGKMHGAKTVNMPAKIEMPKKVILINLRHEATKRRATTPLLNHVTFRVYLHERVLVRHSIFLFQFRLRIIINL